MRRVVCLAVAVVCAVALAGCGDSAEPAPIEQSKQDESSGGGDKEQTPEPTEPADDAGADTLEAMPKAELQAELDTFFADFFGQMETAFKTGETEAARAYCEQPVKPCWLELDGIAEIHDEGGEFVSRPRGYGKPDVFVTFVKGDHVKVDVKVKSPISEIRSGDGSTKPIPDETAHYVFDVERRNGELIMTSGYQEVE